MSCRCRFFLPGTPGNRVAQQLDHYEGLTSPAIQVIDGFPRLLKDVPGTDHILLLLYREGAGGVNKTVLRGWLPDAAQRNFTRNLGRLDQRHLIHQSGDRIFLTDLGITEVEGKGLLDPI